MNELYLLYLLENLSCYHQFLTAKRAWLFQCSLRMLLLILLLYHLMFFEKWKSKLFYQCLRIHLKLYMEAAFHFCTMPIMHRVLFVGLLIIQFFFGGVSLGFFSF